MLSRTTTFFLLVLTACAASPTTTQSEGESKAPATTPWRLELTTSGGITGRGAGDLSVDSAGTVTVKTFAGNRCTVRATSAQLAPLAAAMAKACPDRWAASYKPENPCCDRIESTLVADVAGRKTTTDWVTDPAPMPADLAAVVEELARLQREFDCSGGAGT